MLNILALYNFILFKMLAFDFYSQALCKGSEQE